MTKKRTPRSPALRSAASSLLSPREAFERALADAERDFQDAGAFDFRAISDKVLSLIDVYGPEQQQRDKMARAAVHTLHALGLSLATGGSKELEEFQSIAVGALDELEELTDAVSWWRRPELRDKRVKSLLIDMRDAIDDRRRDHHIIAEKIVKTVQASVRDYPCAHLPQQEQVTLVANALAGHPRAKREGKAEFAFAALFREAVTFPSRERQAESYRNKKTLGRKQVAHFNKRREEVEPHLRAKIASLLQAAGRRASGDELSRAIATESWKVLNTQLREFVAGVEARGSDLSAAVERAQREVRIDDPHALAKAAIDALYDSRDELVRPDDD